MYTVPRKYWIERNVFTILLFEARSFHGTVLNCEGYLIEDFDGIRNRIGNYTDNESCEKINWSDLRIYGEVFCDVGLKG